MDKIWRNGIMGLVVGDALGTPVQFMERDEIRNRPEGLVKGMESGGTFGMPEGTWSDDSSMTLCTMDSILENGAVIPVDVMDRFASWILNGEYTPFGRAFDQGITCSGAIYDYINTHDIKTCGRTGEYSNGNGSLMRILPVCLYYCDKLAGSKSDMTKEVIASIEEISGLTHNHVISKMACGFYYFIIRELIDTSEHIKAGLPEIIQRGIENGVGYYTADSKYTDYIELYKRLFTIDKFEQISEDEIVSSGYVVASLEAAIWCLLKTDSYKDCMLKAVNLGDDTDTIAAIAGGIAGLYYGYEDIPSEWLERIQRREWIEEMCTRADDGGRKPGEYIADIHMHVIPNIDDGAISMEMSLDMLKSAYLQGVRTVFCTSHGEAFYDYIDRVKAKEKYEKLLYACANEISDMHLLLGAECLIADSSEIKDMIWRLDSGELPTLGGTRNVLIEFENGHTSYKDMSDSIQNLKKAGYMPIVAHVERYDMEIPDIKAAEKLHDLGCYFQINAYSIAEEKNPAIRKRTKELLDKGLVDFIGSDAHGSYYRKPMLSRGVNVLYNSYDREYVNAILFKNVEKMLSINTDEEMNDKEKIILYELKSELKDILEENRVAYMTWIEPLTNLKIKDAVVRITIVGVGDNGLKSAYTQKRFGGFIKAYLSEKLNSIVDVEFVCSYDQQMEK